MSQKTAEGSQFPSIIELQSVDSTNNYARKRIYEGLAAHGTTIFAHEQYAGKAQRGKTWKTVAGKNILMSTILDMSGFALDNSFIISAIAAVAIRDVLEKYAQSNIVIKWPNDLYFQDRKAGGILIENIITGKNWNWAIVGFGINITQTQFPEDLDQAVSLKQITGKNYNCIQMAEELKATIINFYNKVITEDIDIVALLNQFLYKKNELVRLKKGNTIFECIVQGVAPSGALMVLKDEDILFFYFGEVEWLRSVSTNN